MIRSIWLWLGSFFFVLSGYGAAQGAPPDMSVCDGLTGVAAGLCRAGVAIGCAEDDANTACNKIAEKYEDLTGDPVPWSPPYPVNTATLTFDDDALDLETGTVCPDIYNSPDCNDSVEAAVAKPNDFFIALDTFRTNPAIVFQRQACYAEEPLELAEIAFLDATPFGGVDVGDIDTALFTTDLVLEPFDPDDTILLHTCEGNYFKVGNAVCNAPGGPQAYPDCQDDSTAEGTVSFDYQRLQ